MYAVLGFIAVIALVIGGILLYNALTGDETAATPTVGVPSVIGMDYDTAQRTLTEAGLGVEPVAQPNPADPNVPENQVWQTDPVADTVVQRDSIVRVFFVPVAEPQPIPDVAGKNVEEAKRLIAEAKFVPGQVTSETSDLPKDTVIRTDPPATTLAKVGSTVNIVLSGGPDTQGVPDVVGQNQDNAKRFLEGTPFNFVVSVLPEASATVPAGAVIRTEPAVGSELASGSPITLIVSTGVQQVNVPPVVGQTEAVARNLITSKGLTANVTYVNVPFGDANDGRVISQSPTGGNLVAPNSPVGLQVGRAVAAPTTVPPTTVPPTTVAPTTTTTTTTTTSTTILAP
jgi:serine/threonine-protein kinase